MQLLGRRSEESNGVELLGIIEEDVPKWPITVYHCHIWAGTAFMRKRVTDCFAALRMALTYFVHSYAMPVNPYTIAQCNYGEAFTAAVQKDNFFGVQFHPERSEAAGAQLLKNFPEM